MKPLCAADMLTHPADDFLFWNFRALIKQPHQHRHLFQLTALKHTYGLIIPEVCTSPHHSLHLLCVALCSVMSSSTSVSAEIHAHTRVQAHTDPEAPKHFGGQTGTLCPQLQRWLCTFVSVLSVFNLFFNLFVSLKYQCIQRLRLLQI